MKIRRLSRFPFAGFFLAGTLLIPARAGEPSPRELIALAPVLDSSDRRCRSLDLGACLGFDGALAPKLRIRTLYRAPNQYSLLISDAADGTPLAFCSAGKIVVYDPVGPAVYYSEDAGFTVEMACSETKFRFRYDYILRNFGKPNRVLVDFRSVFSGIQPAAQEGAFRDRVVRRSPSAFELVRFFYGNRHSLTLNVDLGKECPYTAAAFNYDGITHLRIDRLVLNSELGDKGFAFPVKRRLTRALSVKDVTKVENSDAKCDLSAAVGRALIVRAVVNRSGSSGAIDIPGISGVDWERIKANDNKYAKILKDVLPPEATMGSDEKKGDARKKGTERISEPADANSFRPL